MAHMETILTGLLVWNIIVFLTYAADKQKAVRKRWRIPDATLLMIAFAGGGLGAFLGMHLLRHKTQHLKFKILVPAALVIQAVVAVVVLSGI